MSATSPTPVRSSRAPHLHSVDVVRLATMIAVVAVHVAGTTLPPSDVAAGALLVLLHVTREVFVFLTAFVLAYTYRERPMRFGSFLRRRVPLVAIPYVAWTAIYLAAAGSLSSPWDVTQRFVVDVFDGHARYHLYLLLVTLQLYLVFPWLLRLVRRFPRRHVHLLVAAAAFELACVTVSHYGVRTVAPLDRWLAHPGSWLFAYPLFVFAGILAAEHMDAITVWLRGRGHLVAVACAGAAAVALGSYAIDLHLLAMAPHRASEVFQPAVVAESAAFIAGLFVLGAWLAERGSARRLRWLEASSDRSFGVYLAHPLVLQGVTAGLTALGLVAAAERMPSVLGDLAVLAVVVPLVFVVTSVAVGVARRSRVSLTLTGRPVARRAHAPAPVDVAAARPGADSGADSSDGHVPALATT
jgi:peptidoglycan/LPS O-acetylase OafA/YrhL